MEYYRNNLEFNDTLSQNQNPYYLKVHDFTQEKRRGSPLRYPGGKGFLYPFFSELIFKNDLKNIRYFEPFAGGAGIALNLLSSNIVTEVVLNDADYHIYCFWAAVINHNEQFLDKIRNTELSINNWINNKKIYCDPEKYSLFEVGFSTFFLNRCSRSGILLGAGPIGGIDQKGKWRLNSRFNKENLIKRIADIGKIKDRIFIKNLDAINFLKKYLPYKKNYTNILVYLDPPYINTGDKLYLNHYSIEDHRKLANYLINQDSLKWIVTYNDSLLTRELYSSCQRYLLCIGYSLQMRHKGQELLIAPKWLTVPNKKIFTNKKWRIKKKL